MTPGAGNVDLHSHVLPGVDDGARDLAQALDMLRVAAMDGTTVVAATPHAGGLDVATLSERVEQLNSHASDHGIAITVVPGAETRFDADLIERYRRGRLVTLNQTPYVLVELSLRGAWSPYLAGALSELQLAGLRPVLAHAERYPAVQRDIRLLDALIESGVIVQVNADSVTGTAGRASRATAERLLSTRRAHLLASDAHDARLRPPRLAAAYRRVAQLTDSAYVEMMRAVAVQMLHGEVTELCAPLDAAIGDGPVGLLRRLRRRAQ